MDKTRERDVVYTEPGIDPVAAVAAVVALPVLLVAGAICGICDAGSGGCKHKK